jgi:hypothetical protein
MVERGVGAVAPDDDLVETSTARSDAPASRRPPLRPGGYGLLLLAAVSIQPFAGFVAENPQEELPLVEMAAYAAVVFLLAVGSWLAISWIRRERPTDTLALAVGVVVFAFFHANLILNPYPQARSGGSSRSSGCWSPSSWSCWSSAWPAPPPCEPSPSCCSASGR